MTVTQDREEGRQDGNQGVAERVDRGAATGSGMEKGRHKEGRQDGKQGMERRVDRGAMARSGMGKGRREGRGEARRQGHGTEGDSGWTRWWTEGIEGRGQQNWLRARGLGEWGPELGAYDWPRLAIVAGATSTEVHWSSVEVAEQGRGEGGGLGGFVCQGGTGRGVKG